MRAVRKGELKLNRGGLSDYIAEGELWRGRSHIPCTIGYNVYPFHDDEDRFILRGEYIFITSDGVTDIGEHYEKVTIPAKDVNTYVDILDIFMDRATLNKEV